MKTAVLTGSNSGIGKEVALALAKMDYRVIIHGRDSEKTKLACEEIKAQSGNANVEYIVEDISTLKGMKAFADTVKAKTDTIDSLVLSTGIIYPNLVLTADGFESLFAVQYISRFTITQLLMPELIKGKAKVVLVGAPVMPIAKIFFDDFSMKNNFTMFRAMGQGMYANHLFVQEFAKRNAGTGVTINIGDVGIAKTGIDRHSSFMFKLVVKIIGRTAQQASGSFIRFASDPSITMSGFFFKKAESNAVSKIQYDSAIASKLWEKSMELIKPVLS